MRLGTLTPLGAALVAVLAATASPAALHAQDACSSVPTKPPVGSWSEYQLAREGAAQGRMRFAIVGTETRGGQTMSWFETRMQGGRGTMISQVLVPGYPFEPAKVQEVIMKMDGQPAMRLSGQMMTVMRDRMGRTNVASSFKEHCKEAKLVGEERVTVPAGTFAARHYHAAAGGTDIWVARGVPFGMVKTANAGQGITMELVGTGTGAKPSITETPQEMSGMPGMGPGTAQMGRP